WCEPTSLVVADVSPRVVTGDCVEFLIRPERGPAFPLRYLFLDRFTVAGETSTQMPPHVRAEGSAVVSSGVDLMTHSSADEHTALVTETWGERLFFAFSYSPASDGEAVAQARGALQTHLAALQQRRLLFYDALPPMPGLSERRRRTIAKAVSVLRTGVMSPQGLITCRWTTPDRWPHRDLWLWDSCFHALGCRVFSPDLAAEALEAVLATQREDGFIAHRSSPAGMSDITQPPLVAWTVRKLFTSSQDRTLLEDTYPQIVRFVEWVVANRAVAGSGLLAWRTDDDPLCRCGESGMDNSPRFDEGGVLEAVDLNAYVVSEMRCLADVAAELGRESDASSWRSRADTLAGLMNERLWDDAAGFYFDRRENGDSPPKKKGDSPHFRIRTSAGFLPMFAGVPDRERAGRLVQHLADPNAFWTAFPVPSVARSDRHYRPDMWRGPTWLNIDLLIVEGLRRSGFHDVARDLVDRVLEGVEHWYTRTGCLWEYYDPDGATPPGELDRKERLARGKGIAPISDFGWTAACYLALATGTL
ncbi:MAG TPA: trehalase family glycosidase, partial [Planctomycetota bacterium]|nr:trehalase family glycosidase [Planctomycetota bacterium]